MQRYKRRTVTTASTQMIVPDHILATGEEAKYTAFDGSRGRTRASMLEQMTVPDRIVVNGGDSYKGFGATPKDVIAMDNILDVKQVDYDMHVPQTLTVAETPSPELPANRPISEEDMRSNTSIAVDENPLEELKIMRRQINRIHTKMNQLEEEAVSRRNRDYVMTITTILSLSIAALMAFIRR